jgi:outer membrane murein-binding lipoprotein Lpp
MPGQAPFGWVDMKSLATSVITAVVVYFAVSVAGKPGQLADTVQDHEKRLIVLETKVPAMADDIKAIRRILENDNK